MSLETKQSLEPSTIDKLQTLIRANIDSVNGFREAAKEVEDEPVAQLFKSIAEERSNFAQELQQHVEWNEEEASDDGSFAAKVHRAWLNVRNKLNGGNTHAVLSEAERGEDHIKHAYEEVLKETAGSAMNDVLQRQYARVKAGHDKVRDLRDATKSN